MEEEQSIVNTAGGPNIKGLKGDPFVVKKKKRKKIKPHEIFAGRAVFNVDEDTFEKCKLGKIKYARWKNYVNLEDIDGVGADIRDFASRNPKLDILIKDDRSGSMLFLKRVNNKKV